MLKSPAFRAALVAAFVVALLAILRNQSHRQDRAGRDSLPAPGAPVALDHPREELTVGFLPVT